MARMRSQQGAALLAMMLIVALGASYYMVSRLESMSVEAKAAERAYNAAVLNRAKRALIGYVASQAAKAGENNPGALPCPEAPAYFDDPANEGKVASSCALPKVGRLPWRTLGLDKLTDAGGEALWYVVSPGWGYNGTNTSINSDTKGQLTLDGIAGTDNDTIVALVIAPGPAVYVTAATGCTAWPQVRPTTGTPDWRNYLECDNATSPADVAFVTRGASASFNDQVVALTKGEIMPAIEAAVADRIEREIVPALKSVYASSTWGATISAARPVFPYPAAFANPTTSAYQGSAAQSAGLLPFFQTQNCTPATDPRCTTATTGGSALLVFSKNSADVQAGGLGTIRTQSSCAWSSQVYVCTGEYLLLSIKVTFQLRVTNIAMGLRSFDTSKITCTAVDDAGGGIPLQNIGCQSTGVALQSDGSAIVTVTTNLTPDIIASGWGTYAQYKINFDRAVFGDHALLDSTDTTTGWFVRNEWYRLLYYAVASGYTAAALPGTPGCTDGSTCLMARNPASSLTTLNGGIAGTDTTLVVSSSSGAPATNFRIQVDAEVMRVTAVAGTSWTVVRGTDGSIATAHDDQSRVKLVGRDRAILILAGRSINGATRPSATLADYLEFGNATAAFESQTVSRSVSAALKRPFNDRILVVDSN